MSQDTEERKENRRLAREERLLFSPAAGGDVRVVVAYPNTYPIAMSSLGFQCIYRLFAEQARLVVERAYLPQYDKSPTGFRTFESGASLSDVDILAVSVSFEQDYPQVISLIEASGRDLDTCRELRGLSAAARRREFRPFILGGGVALTLNPEPLANFFDAIVVGEGEEVIPEVVSTYLKAKEEGLPEEEFLAQFSQIEGVYVPSLYQANYHPGGSLKSIVAKRGAPPQVRRRILRDLNSHPTYTSVSTPNTEFSSMLLTETGRGCEQGCRFCVAGYIYRPIRRRSRESIAESLGHGMECCQSVGFVGAAVSSHPAISELSALAQEQGRRPSLSSLMSQKVTTELAESFAKGDARSIALAPEAGSEKLRLRLGKRVSDQQIIDAVCLLVEHGIRKLKLYFMVGLPGETSSDIEDIASLVERLGDQALCCARVQGALRESCEVPKLVLSVNPFIPKPWTPFQRQPMLTIKELKKRLAQLSKLLGRIPNISLKSESPRASYYQTLLSRGDRRVGDMLIEMRQLGLDWRWLVRQGSKAVLDSVPEPDYYVYRQFEQEEILPWEIIDSGIPKELLERECEAAFEGEVRERGSTC